MTMAAPNKKRFGAWLKEARENADMNQDVLGQRLGTKKAHVSKMETGNLVPTLEVIDKLTRALGVPFSRPLVELGYLPESNEDRSGVPEGLATRYSQLSPDNQLLVDEIMKVIYKQQNAKLKLLLPKSSKRSLPSARASAEDKDDGQGRRRGGTN